MTDEQCTGTHDFDRWECGDTIKSSFDRLFLKWNISSGDLE